MFPSVFLLIFPYRNRPRRPRPPRRTVRPAGPSLGKTLAFAVLVVALTYGVLALVWDGLFPNTNRAHCLTYGTPESAAQTCKDAWVMRYLDSP